jgi:8-oxo-dGTP pyrophosphatase MutT (NUDIX family)
MLTNIDLPIEDRDSAVLAATILLVRDGDDGLEILLLKRNSNAKNMADVWMFPGGKIDDEDAGSDELERAARGGLRELREEADISLDLDSLTTFSHWLTPAGQKRRFATWFFIAVLPAEAAVKVDGEEMVEAAWMSPRHAVEAHRAGRLRLPPPTVVSLLDVSHSDSALEAIQRANKRQAPYFYPKILADNPEDIVMLYPGDAGYETGDREAEGDRHRAFWVDGVIDYERSFEFPAA